MSSQPDLVSYVIETVPDLAGLEQQLADAPEEILEQAFPAGDAAPRTRAIVGADDDLDLPQADGRVRRRALEHARAGLEKIRTQGAGADLSPAEQLGTEAIVLMTGRPAILFHDGAFLRPPSAWEVLERHRERIEATARSVGRIEVGGHPELDWVGTGFLVAPDVVMTNRHVAKEFARQEGSQRWTFEPGMAARIDYVEELAATASQEWAIEEVIGVHDTLDLALLRVIGTGDAEAPEPLAISGERPDELEGREVFVIGYPAWDGRRNDPPVMQRIFANVFDVKRLQPGLVRAYVEAQDVFEHDCSTLGGNSGSCVVDLQSGVVVGLHFSGRYREGNLAVALWTMTDDELLASAGIGFG